MNTNNISGAQTEDLTERATIAAAAWADANTPVATALAFRDGYIVGMKAAVAGQPVEFETRDAVARDVDPAGWQFRDLYEGEWTKWRHCGALMRERYRDQPDIQFRPLYLRASAPHAGAPAWLNHDTQAAHDVLAERRRQVTEEGWTPQHDDQHADGDLAAASACYALHAGGWQPATIAEYWPWAPSWWKPTTKRRDLVKSVALGIAEIERLDRAQPVAGGSNVQS
ncbi:hypothetical protein [Paraburkholderia sp. J10-1]|uniref:hypothetical protein n=1 Tax=Paraburkholderia sp. J10-1 TaxID=2805430 RepID=UPI002AB73BFA|nr:hypothetical protein [Paraburkholderia sp. J10-1]